MPAVGHLGDKSQVPPDAQGCPYPATEPAVAGSPRERDRSGGEALDGTMQKPHAERGGMLNEASSRLGAGVLQRKLARRRASANEERTAIAMESLPPRVEESPELLEIRNLLGGDSETEHAPEIAAPAEIPAAGDSRKGRAPHHANGIATTVLIDPFVAAAKHVEHDWATLTPEKRAGKLGDAANQALEGATVPACKLDLKDLQGGRAGEFEFPTWTLALGSRPFSAPAVTAPQASTVAETVYHEARHAEQWHRMARFEAGQKKTAAEIENKMSIPKAIAEDAEKKPLNRGGPASKEAARWFGSVYGKGSKHRGRVLHDLGPLFTANETAQHHYEATNKDVHATDEEKRRALDAWRSAYNAFQKVYQQYRALPEEADAFQTQAIVKHEYSKG